MDAITSTGEEKNVSIDDGKEPMTEVLVDGVKPKLYVGEEKEQEICFDVSDQNVAKREMLHDNAALSGYENQMESSSELDKRGDEDDEKKDELGKNEEEMKILEEMEREESEREMSESECKELERELEELKKEELEKEMEEDYIEFEYFEDYMEFEYMEDLEEKQRKNEKQRGKGKTKSKKLGPTKMEAHLQASKGEDLSMIDKKRTNDNQEGKRRKAKGLNVDSSIESINSSDVTHLIDANLKIEENEPIENDEDMDNKSEDESDGETGVNLSDRALKESWEDPSDDESTSLESSSKEIVPEDSKLKESKSRSCKKKKDSVKLRSPVVCVLGHVDSGKTTMLDFIRKTHVQDAEAGGITQQIGATMIPREALREKCKMANDFSTFDLKLPGLLVIDTPGHELFKNLRSRGISMCDIAVLVVDIMDGLKPQTMESINILRGSGTPFIVALNKVDRLYGWENSQDSDVESTVNRQGPVTRNEFKKKCQDVIARFANERFNVALYYENPDLRTYVSIVPTSAISGDGMGNLLSLIVKLAQTNMRKKLVLSEELNATVLEVKALQGLGTTIDVILINGRLKEGDTIVMRGRQGPIVVQIRSLLTPHPLKEMRVKNQYVKHKSIEGAQSVKITGKGLEMAIAGLPLFVARKPSDVEPLKEVVAPKKQLKGSIKTSRFGVYVKASTLGSLEAFLEYLTSIDIPYSAVDIGPVVKLDVERASAMLESDIQYATILAFDVKVEREAQERADALGVKVLPVDVIYHAGDEFLKHREKCEKTKEEALSEAVYPCICKVLTSGIKSFEVSVEKGYLRVGTPLLAKDVARRGRKNLQLGVVTSIHAVDGSSVDKANVGDKVKIQVKSIKEPVPVIAEERLGSQISRKSLELLKKYCRRDFSEEVWKLILQLRNPFNSFD